MLQTDVQQAYDQYTQADHQVWRELYRHQADLVCRHACREYLDGLDRLGLPADRVVCLEELNLHLDPVSPWKFVAAPGFLPGEDFFRSIGDWRFPVTVAVRKPHELEFAELPDIFHDVYGHGPMLLSPAASELYAQFSRAALRRLDDETFLGRLAKLFWVAFEVGLVRERGEVKAYGGAILSSRGEIANVFGEAAGMPIREFQLARVVATGFQNLELQREYYVVDSLDVISDAVRRLEQDA